MLLRFCVFFVAGFFFMPIWATPCPPVTCVPAGCSPKCFVYSGCTGGPYALYQSGTKMCCPSCPHCGYVGVCGCSCVPPPAPIPPSPRPTTSQPVTRLPSTTVPSSSAQQFQTIFGFSVQLIRYLLTARWYFLLAALSELNTKRYSLLQDLPWCS